MPDLRSLPGYCRTARVERRESNEEGSGMPGERELASIPTLALSSPAFAGADIASANANDDGPSSEDRIAHTISARKWPPAFASIKNRADPIDHPAHHRDTQNVFDALSPRCMQCFLESPRVGANELAIFIGREIETRIDPGQACRSPALFGLQKMALQPTGMDSAGTGDAEIMRSREGDIEDPGVMCVFRCNEIRRTIEQSASSACLRGSR